MRLTGLARVLLIASISAAAASPARDDLKGTVTADGRPLSGATVMIYTAAVKVGTSTFCPSCYADCGKRAVTDHAGQFTIASLDRELTFRVLVVADGYRPTFVQHVNPAAGPIAAKLDPTPAHLDPARILRGKVVGPDGEAVVGAEVSPKFTGLGELAITDARGEFLLVADHAVPQRVMLGVDARGFAPHVFDSIDAAKGAVTLSVEPRRDPHRPRAPRRQAARRRRCPESCRPTATSRPFTGPRTIATSADGRFEFDNIGPPRQVVRQRHPGQPGQIG